MPNSSLCDDDDLRRRRVIDGWKLDLVFVSFWVVGEEMENIYWQQRDNGKSFSSLHFLRLIKSKLI